MAFECEQCGECCSHLGLVHSIAEDRGNYEFVVFNLYTNESDVVTVDPDKHAIYDDKSIFAALPEACPFFRHQPGSEKAFCTVHLTRPDICRDYGCWRMLNRKQGRTACRADNVREVPLLGRSARDENFREVHRSGQRAGRCEVGRSGYPGADRTRVHGPEVRAG